MEKRISWYIRNFEQKKREIFSLWIYDNNLNNAIKEFIQIQSNSKYL